MRDQETMAAALTIAETGHLTLATLHTNSTFESINRIVDSFPATQQSQVRAQLAFVLEGVMAQQLVPRARGKGRVLIAEVMVCTPPSAQSFATTRSIKSTASCRPARSMECRP